MRILHVIPSLSPTQGGPSMALPAMARVLAGRGVQVDVATTDDDGHGCRSEQPHGLPLERDGFRAFVFPKQTEFYKVSLPLLAWLWRHVADYDVVHVHAVFSFATLAAGWSASLRGVPFIVRPLGVLNSWGMDNRRRWIKALSFRLLDKPVLDRAAAIHYTSRAEEREAARHGLRARAVVIPLGIDLSPFKQLPDQERFLERFPPARGRKIVLFLSRIDPKKGIEVLLAAFARLEPVESAPILVIAGSGDATYVAGLKARAVALGLEPRVIWVGFLDGADKLAAFAAADLFVLPSHSENFGVALLEAMAAGLACVSTPGVALAAEAAAQRAVILSDSGPVSLAGALQQLLGNPVERRALSERAAALAFRDYSAETMSAALVLLYRSCTAKTDEN